MCKSGESLRLAGPRLARLHRQQLSGTSWRKERFFAWLWGTRTRRWLGALVVRFSSRGAHRTLAARAGCRDARVVTLGGARWWASLEAPRTRKPAGVYRQVSAVPREGGGRPIEVGGPGWVGGWVDRPRSASAGAKSGGVF